uniref:Hyaluronan/mRNA-binding protein domain-containing protein n=1 Tax=Cannabis sativa TaxID=3483 RepID=A0A803PDW2_CANSA
MSIAFQSLDQWSKVLGVGSNPSLKPLHVGDEIERWITLIDNSVNINVDIAIFSETGNYEIGFAVRDSSRRLLVAATRLHSGSVELMVVEALRIKEVLKSSSVLNALKEKGIDLAVASRTPTPKVASAFLKTLAIDSIFLAKEIYPSSTHKTKHFQEIHNKTGVPFSSMLFFDDEDRNIRAVSKMGVTCILVENGVNLGALRQEHENMRLEFPLARHPCPAGQGAVEEGDSGRERRGYGGPRGDFSNGEGGEGERSHRPFERRSGTGRGSEFKREEAVNETEKNFGDENPKGEGGAAADGNKEAPPTEQEEKEPEDKEMTLEEYQKVLEEKRKALQALKAEERKVDTKEFASMQQISSKKENQDIFIKLGSEKDKKKQAAERDERAKKSVSINEFLKPAEGERYFTPGGRGRGRGRGGSRGGGFAGNYQSSNVSAPSIEDPGHFPTLGGK